MDNEGRTAEYKGKTYKLLYLGNTKFGRRAHLAFRDGSSQFWVNADLITENKQSDSTEADPDRNAYTDAGIAEQIVSAGVQELARGCGGDPKKMMLINNAAAWLRQKVRSVSA